MTQIQEIINHRVSKMHAYKWGGMGHTGVGWGEVGHTGVGSCKVGWIMQGWGVSYRGRVGCIMQ